MEIRSALIGFHVAARLAPVGNVLCSTTNDPSNQQREPKKNHGACYGAEEKDLFGMMYSKGATEDFYVSHGEAILHRYINPESCSRNYQYKSDDDHGFSPIIGFTRVISEVVNQ